MAPTTKKATAKKAEAPKAETPKRKVYTPEEKVAKLEADLQAARDKAAEAKQKKLDDLGDKKAKLVEKLDAIRLEIAAVDKEIEEAGPKGEPLFDADAEGDESSDEDTAD